MTEKKLKSVAFIPARSGSKRVIDKNIRELNGHPLLSYTITAAIQSKVFDKIICVTDDELYADIAKYYGAEVPELRPKNISGDKSPDIDWVNWIVRQNSIIKEGYDFFSILRPTSPFRLPETIIRAYNTFKNLSSKVHSLRAVEKCKQHPGKMWILEGDTMLPLLPEFNEKVPWHSCQYSSLPEVYVQNASLEFAWFDVLSKFNSISGEIIAPFLTENLEGFDINIEEDWVLANNYIKMKAGVLPEININSFIKQEITN